MRGLQLGKIFGIRITLDWTVIVIFLLVTFQLGAGLFPHWHPMWSAALTWGVALAAAIVFFASILVHELAHAWVGMAYGMKVRSITLFIFGGMANIERRPPHARAELLMALAGPATSLILGGGFILLSGVLSDWAVWSADDPEAAVASLGPAATLLAWVGPINVILAVFNMLPGFPLDGGRVLRAALWWATGNMTRATRIAAAVGRALAWIFIIMGIAMAFGVAVPFFGRGVGGGLWLALIGWFLHHAATASWQDVLLEKLLEDVEVHDIMVRHPLVISPSLTVRELVEQHLLHEDQRAYPVVENDRFVGMLCLEDVRKLSREHWKGTLVGAIMTPAHDVASTNPDAPALDAVRRLGQRNVGQLPVLEGDRVVGLFRRQDFMRWLELQPRDIDTSHTGSSAYEGREPTRGGTPVADRS